MAKVMTYSPKQVKIALGTHVVTGYADDSFVTIEASGEGVAKKTGCDGEVVRAISPDRSYNIKVAILQTSPTSKWLLNQFEKDQSDGTGTFAITVKDITGDTKFTTDCAWVVKCPSWVYGKDSNNREWELACGEGHLNIN